MKSLLEYINESLDAKSKDIVDVLFKVCTLDRDENDIDERAVEFEKALKDEIRIFVNKNKNCKFNFYTNNKLEDNEIKTLQKLTKENSDILIYDPKIYHDGSDMTDKVRLDLGVKKINPTWSDKKLDLSKIYRWDDCFFVDGFYCQVCFWAENWH